MSRTSQFEDLKELLGRPILIYYDLIPIVGSPSGAQFLSQAIYWQNIMNKKNKPMWYKSDRDWSEEIHLSPKQITKIRNYLKELKLIKICKKGIPCTNHYQIDFLEISSRLIDHKKNQTNKPKSNNSKNKLNHIGNSDNELTQIKKDTDFIQVAEEYEYSICAKESDLKYTIMKNGSDTIVVNFEGEYAVYFNRNDDNDSGTIIDFIKNRSAKSIEEIRKDLRSSRYTSPISHMKKQHLTSSKSNNDESSQTFINNGCIPIETHPYLSARGISEDLQLRYPGSLYQSKDRHKNVVFPLIDEQNICGADIRNGKKIIIKGKTKLKNYKVLQKGCKRGIWVAKDPQANGVVIAESPIDALSFMQCRPHLRMNLISFAGALSNNQFNSIINKAGNLPVFICVDNDANGQIYTNKIIKLFPSATICIPDGCNDWNDVLTEDLEPAV